MNLAYKKYLVNLQNFEIWENPPPPVRKDSQIMSFFSFDSEPYLVKIGFISTNHEKRDGKTGTGASHQL